MATLEDNIFSLITLLIGGGLGAALNHLYANLRRNRDIELENRRREEDIKDDIASKITEVISYTMANALLASKLKITASNSERIQAEDDESVRKFHVDVNVINTKLRIYFSEPTINEKWGRYHLALLAFRFYSKDFSFEHTTEEQKSGLESRKKTIREYFSDHKEIDWNRFTTQTTPDKNLWGDLANLFQYRGLEIIEEIFKLQIKTFSS